MDFNHLTDNYTSIYNKYKDAISINDYDADKIGRLREKMDRMYPKICEASLKESNYFIGATLELYKKKLDKRINSSKNKNPDFSIYVGYRKEYLEQRKLLINPPPQLSLLNGTNISNFKSVITKRIEYLEIIMFELGIDIKKKYDPDFGRTNVTFTDNLERRLSYEKRQKPLFDINNTVKWKGSNVELAELIKALISSNKLDSQLSQEEIFLRFGMFLDFKVNERKGIDNIQSRKPETPQDRLPYLTKFLDQLKNGLINWYSLKEKDKEYR